MLVGKLQRRVMLMVVAAILAVTAMAAVPALAKTVLDVYPDSYTPKNPVQDNITRLNVNKMEKGARDYVKGAHLAIYERDSGKLVTEWVSDGTTHEVARNAEGTDQGALDVNVVYVLRELSAPEGYEKAADVEFIIRSDENFNTSGEIISGSEDGNAESEQIRGSGPEQAFVISLFDQATVNVTDEERRTRQQDQEREQQLERQNEENRTNQNSTQSETQTSASSTTSSSTSQSGLTQTGDETSNVPVIVLCVTGVAVVAAAVILRRRK